MEQSLDRRKQSFEIGKFSNDDRQRANPEKQSDEYTIPPADTKSREIKVTLQSLEKAK